MIPLWAVPLLALGGCAVGAGLLLLVVFPLVAKVVLKVRQRRFVDEIDRYLKGQPLALTSAYRKVLAGEYLSTDPSRCDVENRLFTNPGASCFPKGVTAIRFERGMDPPPDPRRRSLASAGTCTTTATTWAGHGAGGNRPRHWRAGAG